MITIVARPIKNLTYKLVPDAASGAIALEDGTLDCYYIVAASDYEHMKISII